MSEPNEINKKIAAGMMFVSSITGLMKASPIEEHNHNSQPDVSSSQTGENPSIYTTLTHGQSLSDQIEESYGKNFEQTKEKRDRDLETALQADQEKSRTASGSPDPDPQKQTVPNHEKMPLGEMKSMETFKKPFSSEQIPQTPEEAIDAEGITIKPSSQSDTSTAPITQEERARDLLSKGNLKPERREDLESKYGKLANPSEQPQSQPQESTDRSESRNKLEELRARCGLPNSQADQTPLDRTESGDQSNEEPTQTSLYLGYRGNPNPNSYVSEVNGKMEPGTTISAEKMANLTAKHNEALNNVGPKYRAASDTALNNALAEKYAPKEQPTANSEPQEVNQDEARN